MRLRLLPKDENFHELFEQLAEQIEIASKMLYEMLGNGGDVEAQAERIAQVEHEGDAATHEVMRRVNSTFVTPFDREDIHLLTHALDDVIDHIHAAADYTNLYKIQLPHPALAALAKILHESAVATTGAMPSLRKMRDISEYLGYIEQLEKQGDRTYRRTIAELFSGGHEATEIMKVKDVVEQIEEGIDRLEDVANAMESIVLKQG